MSCSIHFGRVAARLLELVERPVVPGLLEVGAVAEEELLLRLAAEGRELGADARLALHAGDVVAARAAVLAHQLLAVGDVRRIGEPRLAARPAPAPSRPSVSEVGGDRPRLVVGEAEARHAGDVGVAARVLDPVVDPAARRSSRRSATGWARCPCWRRAARPPRRARARGRPRQPRLSISSRPCSASVGIRRRSSGSGCAVEPLRARRPS